MVMTHIRYFAADRWRVQAQVFINGEFSHWKSPVYRRTYWGARKIAKSIYNSYGGAIWARVHCCPSNDPRWAVLRGE